MAHKCIVARRKYNREYAKRYRVENPKKYAAARVVSELKRQRRRNFLYSVKQTYGCEDCGYNENPVALQFDHLPEFDKINRISALTKGNFTKLIDEIVKCEVVCANCHAIRTHQRAVA